MHKKKHVPKLRLLHEYSVIMDFIHSFGHETSVRRRKTPVVFLPIQFNHVKLKVVVVLLVVAVVEIHSCFGCNFPCSIWYTIVD